MVPVSIFAGSGQTAVRTTGSHPYRFIAHFDAPPGPEVFDMLEAPGKPGISPNQLAFDVGWEPVPGKQNWFHDRQKSQEG